MAATSAAAVGSSFSLKYLTWPNEHHLVKVSFPCTKTVLHPASSLSHALGTTTDLFTPISSTKWKVLCIAGADVAQEEAAVEVEEKPVVEEKEENSNAAAESDTEVNTKVYFGNLPYLCDSAQLAGIIQEYASPELVEVLYDRDTGRSRGFAFVTMSSIEDANTVIQNLDGREFGGRTLRVNLSDKPKPKEPLYPETEHKLFVGNLSWAVTSESLTEAFRECGNVVGARVLYDGETGRSRGYGFVSYETKAEMEAALIALDGLELEGRAIRVSLAQGKRE